MSETRPITTPPKRRNYLLAHVQHVFNGGSSVPGAESSMSPNQSTSTMTSQSSNGTIRPLEPYHHALLESSCQSAKSSPLPHRRLDRLEGMIRDKPISPAISSMRRPFDTGNSIDDNSIGSSCESSPAFMRKRLNSCNENTTIGNDHHNHHHRFINNHQESPMPYRKQQNIHNQLKHIDSTGADFKNAINKAFRFDTASCGGGGGGSGIGNTTCCDNECRCSGNSSNSKRFNNTNILSPQMHRKILSSPTKGTIGEPGCFSSPIHHGHSGNGHFNAFGSPAKSVLGEPGIFASPARSLCSNVANFDDIDADEITSNSTTAHTDQSIVSGWLKFRDNKRVSYSFFFFFYYFFSLLRIFMVTFFSVYFVHFLSFIHILVSNVSVHVNRLQSIHRSKLMSLHPEIKKKKEEKLDENAKS